MIDSLYYHSTIRQYIAISPICICILTLSDVALLPFVSVFKSYVSLSLCLCGGGMCVYVCVFVCVCVCVCVHSSFTPFLSVFPIRRLFKHFCLQP